MVADLEAISLKPRKDDFERDTILRTLRQRGVRNLVFLAADVHFAQLIRHRPIFDGPTSEWSFHEFIAGPLAASTGQPRPLDQGLSPRSLWSLGGTNTFGDIAISAMAHVPTREAASS